MTNNDYYFENDIEKFSGYERNLAECHMSNWGKIVCSSQWHDVIEVEDVCYLIEDGIISL